MESCNMTEDNSVEIYNIPCGDVVKMEFVKYYDFIELQKKADLFETIAKEAFFAGFELSKFFPSDSDISKKWIEYKESMEIKEK